MLISIKWLNSFVDTSSIPLAELVDRVSESGNEVDTVTEYPCVGVVTALVEAKEKHPNADTLAVCTVFDGSQRYNVVCGATNVDAGQVIPFAPIGAKLPEMVLRKVKIRGVESQGMICSKTELGFPDSSDEDGIWVLGHASTSASTGDDTGDAIALGQDVAELYALGDTVLDIGLTPNRGDCLSIRGIAREVHAVFGVATPLVQPHEGVIAGLPAEVLPNGNGSGNGGVSYCVTDGAADHYLLASVRGVCVGESSPVVQARLHACGVRPINSIVDTTNYVMLELGQPMHAFDADHIAGNIAVRLCGEGESVVTLDGVERSIPAGVPVIADDDGIVAVAGVMGGLRGSVTATTTNILLESAVFPPNLVRRSAKLLGLPTDSSHRFERGIDLSTTETALQYAIALLVGYGDGVEYSYCVDTSDGGGFALPPKPIIEFDEGYIPALLGVESMTHETIASNLEKLGYGVELANGKYAITVPYHRLETARYPADIAEEVVRLYGINNLPNKLPKLFAKATELPAGFQERRNLSSAFVHQGFFEVVTYPFIKGSVVEMFDSQPNADADANADANANGNNHLTLRNPISEDMKTMRTSMVSNLVTTFVANFNQGVRWGKLFEFGSVYTRIGDDSNAGNDSNSGDGMNVHEEARIALLSYGDEHFASYPFTHKDTKAETQFFILKGVVARAFAALGHTVEFDGQGGSANAGKTAKWLHPGRSCNIILKGKFPKGKEGVVVGVVGELHPEVAKKCDAPEGVVVAEMYTQLARNLAKKRIVKYKTLQRSPDIRKDIAVIVDENMPLQNLTQTVQKVKLGNALKLVNVYIIDQYRNKKTLEGKKSITLRLLMNAGETTPTDTHLNDAMANVLKDLENNNNAHIREA